MTPQIVPIMKVSIAVDGTITINCPATHNFVKDDTYKFEIEGGAVLTLKCTTAGTDNAAVWSISIEEQ